MMLQLLLLMSIIPLHACRVECFYVIGRLRCPTDPAKVSLVQIDLMDEDSLPLEQDDTMGRTWTLKNGSFIVTGCGSDFGPFNTPDGYLNIFHTCPHRSGKTPPGSMQVDILPIYMPAIQNLGSIYLDRYIDDE